MSAKLCDVNSHESESWNWCLPVSCSGWHNAPVRSRSISIDWWTDVLSPWTLCKGWSFQSLHFCTEWYKVTLLMMIIIGDGQPLRVASGRGDPAVPLFDASIRVSFGELTVSGDHWPMMQSGLSFLLAWFLQISPLKFLMRVNDLHKPWWPAPSSKRGDMYGKSVYSPLCPTRKAIAVIDTYTATSTSYLYLSHYLPVWTFVQLPSLMGRFLRLATTYIVP